jgi:hypothetical protein
MTKEHKINGVNILCLRYGRHVKLLEWSLTIKESRSGHDVFSPLINGSKFVSPSDQRFRKALFGHGTTSTTLNLVFIIFK